MSLIWKGLSIFLLIFAVQNVESAWGNSYVSGHSKNFLTLEPNFETSTKHQSIFAKPSKGNKYFRAVMFITYDDSIGTNEIEQHEITPELFNKLTTSSEYAKSSGTVKSTYNTLAFFDGKCDVSVECKPPRIEDCTTTYKPCECTTTPRPPSTTRPSTTKPSTTKPTIKSTTRPSTTRPSTTKPSTTKPTIKSTTRPSTTKPTIKSTTRPSTTKPTIKSTTKPSTTRPSTTKPTIKSTTRFLLYSPIPAKSRSFTRWTGTIGTYRWPTHYPTGSNRPFVVGSSWRTYSFTRPPIITIPPQYYQDDKGNWYRYLVGDVQDSNSSKTTPKYHRRYY